MGGWSDSVAAHEAGAAVLDPAEALAERRLDPGLHGVGLVPGHPPPPLRLGVARRPPRRRAPLAAAPVVRRRRLRTAPELLLQAPHRALAGSGRTWEAPWRPHVYLAARREKAAFVAGAWHGIGIGMPLLLEKF
jgi:hypothetical protein